MALSSFTAASSRRSLSRKAELEAAIRDAELRHEVQELEKKLQRLTTASPYPPTIPGTGSSAGVAALLGDADVTLDQLRKDSQLLTKVDEKLAHLDGASVTKPPPSKGLAAQLAALDRDVVGAKQSAFAEGTYKNLKTQWRAYLLFCEHFRLTALPAKTRTLARYAQFLSRSLKCVNSIKIYLHGVRLLHLFQGLTPPPAGAFDLRLVLSSLQRHSTHVPQQKLPITPAILLQIHGHLDVTRPLHATLWAAFCVAFFGLLRKSNLVPKSSAAFDTDKHLTRQSFHASEGGLVLHITWSKTLQFKQKVLRLPLPVIPGHPLCPTQAYLNMCRLLPAPPHAPAFLIPSRAGVLVTLTHDTLVTHLKTLLHTAGFPAARFSGHSFRRGGATYAWHCGADPATIKLLGDWSSDAYERYLDSSLEQPVRN
ncbi:PREDICTED: uncharacterized protein LOC109463749 [Branchiostoma belcheri]|uniref:Uncharacterized protein LOC109463749 n=1 Tax=Branchiostoma belcheri TaxID=7741 RepID=A0A6P4XHZ7_BRABE|nr:PREDICTED: uncharacterized protein LOC109463749 [Branchiostoma belcheri]